MCSRAIKRCPIERIVQLDGVQLDKQKSTQKIGILSGPKKMCPTRRTVQLGAVQLDKFYCNEQIDCNKQAPKTAFKKIKDFYAFYYSIVQT